MSGHLQSSLRAVILEPLAGRSSDGAEPTQGRRVAFRQSVERGETPFADLARATQTTANVLVYAGMHELLPNTPLAERMQTHLEQVGAPAWDEGDQEFARTCQRELGMPEAGLAGDVLPLPDEPSLGGATDVAEASWITPTMGVAMPTMPLGVTLHTWPVTACGGMSIGIKGALAATDVLTRMALDLLTDAELRAAARADLVRRRGDYAYISPLPPDQRHPIDLPDWLITDGSAEAMGALERNP